MHADIDGAVQIVCLAAGFDWSWTVGDLDDFCAAGGWTEERRSDLGASFRTGLNLDRDTARARFDRESLARLGDDSGEVLEARVLVSSGIDEDDPYSGEKLVDLFAQLSSRITEQVGPESRRRAGTRPGLVWELPGLTVVLEAGNFVSLTLGNPVYRRWQDDAMSRPEGLVGSDAEESDLPRPSTWLEFDRALALTLALLPQDGSLLITTPSGSTTEFRMDEFQLDCTIRLEPGAASDTPIAGEQRTRLVEEQWVQSVDQHGTRRDRLVRWPAGSRDFRELADSAMVALQDTVGVRSPLDLRIQAWAVRGENVPNIALLGRNSMSRRIRETIGRDRMRGVPTPGPEGQR